MVSGVDRTPLCVRVARWPMRPDSPAPSITSLVTSWLSLTRCLFSACVERANTIVEGGDQAIHDAVMDVGCPPPERTADADELPPLDPEAFVLALRERSEETLRRAAEVINQEPHVCLAPVTRDR